MKLEVDAGYPVNNLYHSQFSVHLERRPNNREIVNYKCNDFRLFLCMSMALGVLIHCCWVITMLKRHI